LQCLSQHFNPFPTTLFSKDLLSPLQSYMLSLMVVNDILQKCNYLYAKIKRKLHTLCINRCFSGTSCFFLGCLCCPTVNLGPRHNHV
jgi:hypothetical protein